MISRIELAMRVIEDVCSTPGGIETMISTRLE